MSDRTRIEAVLKQVQDWPASERLALATEMLCKVRATPLGQTPRRTAEIAAGLFRGAGDPPSDADVKRWIEEERISKYVGR